MADCCPADRISAVTAVLDLNNLPDNALALTDMVCLNSEDAAELTLQLDRQDE
ncbi:hypothetical protein [Rhodospirillaceae bacterium SYSU D60014]|uniref:hypothetical protein n=1 Tax=Virgifigura deserti TaxID=2268457 RepID=UPI0013C45924